MWRLLLLLVVAGLGVIALYAEPFAPTVTLETPVDTVGRGTTLRVVARDRGSGLAHIELRLVPEGSAPVVVAEEHFPRRSWRGSGVHETTITPTLDLSAAKVPEGRATLELRVADHSWLAGLRRKPQLTHPVTIDLTPPTLEIPPTEHVARLGGAECVVYKVGPDTVRTGVEVGPRFFPATAGLFADPALRVALFALPPDTPEAQPTVVVSDQVGNTRRLTFGVTVTPRRFADKIMPLSDDFLARKVPELLQANELETSGDLVTGYLRINRDLRATSEARLREMCRETASTPRWEGSFHRLPNAAPLSGFADHRTYVYGGKTVDEQTHLGFDLASIRGSAVPAGNRGRVVFAGPLGIYGNTVVLDHGLGLFSLYGHLSTMQVTAGADVARGDMLGNTGDTGLAAGDHLHFSTMIHGVHVDPVEWWDAHWIRDHVESRLNAYPRSGGAS